MLTKSTSAEVQIALRTSTLSGPTLAARAIPLETFATNKDMGRILIRRGGETIAAGKRALFHCVRGADICFIIGIVIDVDNKVH